MIGCRPLEWKQRFGASVLFGSTGLVASHVFIVPDFICEMGVWQWGLGWQVWHDVCIMDHSEMAVDLLAEVSRKDLVAHSWLAEGIKLVHMVENLLQVKCSEHCKCASETEACYHDLGVPVN